TCRFTWSTATKLPNRLTRSWISTAALMPDASSSQIVGRTPGRLPAVRGSGRKRRRVPGDPRGPGICSTTAIARSRRRSLQRPDRRDERALQVGRVGIALDLLRPRAAHQLALVQQPDTIEPLGLVHIRG